MVSQGVLRGPTVFPCGFQSYLVGKGHPSRTLRPHPFEFPHFIQILAAPLSLSRYWARLDGLEKRTYNLHYIPKF